jgi:AcrR family transcriptional regulator
VSETPLSRLLAQAERRPDALSAFRLARRRFKDGRRIEMQELAAELGVSRATLFRWVGGRDDLLAEVLASLALPTLAKADESATQGHGGARVARVMEAFCRMLLESDYFGSFLQREPERALRVLTTRDGIYQVRLVAAVQAILEREAASGHLEPPLPLHDLADLVVRIMETFLYSDLVTGETADSEKVAQAIATLLRP